MDVYLKVFILLAILVSLLFWYFKQCYLYWKEREVYMSNKPKFIFGNALRLLSRQVSIHLFFKEIYDDCQKNFQKISGFYFFGKPCLVIADMDLAENILKSEHFMDRAFQSYKSEPLSEHIFSLKGSKWKTLRAQLSPAFTSAKTKMMFPTMSKYADKYIDVLQKISSENKVVEIRHLTNKFSIDVIGTCAFGIDCNCLTNPNSEFEYYVNCFSNPSIKDSLVMLLSFLYPDVLYWVRVRAVRKDVGNFFSKIVSDNIKHREENNILRPDFMHLLIQIRNNVQISENEMGVLKNKNDNQFTLSEANVTAQSLVFFMAGYETSASIISFCLYELAINPDLQTKARQDVIKNLTKHNEDFTYDAINQMTFIENCIKETLRKYGPPPVHVRECSKSYKLPGTKLIIEKGTPIIVPAFGIHMDPKIFPNPEKFDPDRFSEIQDCKRHALAWTPFGFGPRVCIGMKFALLEMKTCVAKLIKNFEFSANHLTEVPLTINPKCLIVAAKNGVWLNVKKIN